MRGDVAVILETSRVVTLYARASARRPLAAPALKVSFSYSR
jgi:hypothetical protein